MKLSRVTGKRGVRYLDPAYYQQNTLRQRGGSVVAERLWFTQWFPARERWALWHLLERRGQMGVELYRVLEEVPANWIVAE